MSKIEKIQELQEILHEDSENYQARRQLAVLLLDSGFSEEALQHFLYLSKIFENDSGIFYNLGIVYEKLKNFEKAKDAYIKSIELSPDEMDAYYNLGLVLTELKDYDGGIACFEKVLENDPHDSNSYFSLGICQLKKVNSLRP